MPSTPQVEGASHTGQLQLDDGGGLGAHDSFGKPGGPRVRRNRWQTVTCAVDCAEGLMATYVDGEAVAEVRAPELAKDGAHALRMRLALLWEGEGNYDSDDLDYLSLIHI